MKKTNSKIRNQDKQRLALSINDELTEMYPCAECALHYDGEPWKLLVMARLSAQCTDERVNLVCADLFSKFPTVESLANADISEIEAIIRPCGLFRGKARSIKDSCAIIVDKYGGKLPDNMESLLELPGVGRKIANLLLGDIYGKGGIVADTHCIRISCRLGLADKNNPIAVEKALSPIIPLSLQSDFCHRLVMFGRDICTARSPRCEACPLREKSLCGGSNDETR